MAELEVGNYTLTLSISEYKLIQRALAGHRDNGPEYDSSKTQDLLFDIAEDWNE